MTMPQQKPATSRQDYETPPEFIAAVEARWGKLAVDFACSAPTQTDLLLPDNRKAPHALAWPTIDSLTVDWASSYGDSHCWLNPPFRQCGDFAEKCAREVSGFGRRGRIFFLTPASVGSNWFYEFVFEKAFVMPLLGRMTFVGEVDMFPKDLMLSIFMRDAEEMIRGGAKWFEPWRWKPAAAIGTRRGRAVEDIDAL